MEEKKEETQDVKKKGGICCLICLIKKCIVLFVPGIIVALILFVIISAALGPTSSVAFCGEKCHEMDKAYASWKASPHAVNRTGVEVGCIECHLPPKSKFFTHLTAKAYTGTKDAMLHIVNADYDAKEIRKKVRKHMTNEVCLRCHNKFKGNPFDEDITEFHDEDVFNVAEGETPPKCIECHADAAHMRDDEE